MPAHPTPTPPTARGAATRARILAAAARLMDEHGVDGTSVDRILAEADAGKGQFYHYFSNKEQLVAEAAALRTQGPLATLERHLRYYRRWDALERWMRAAVEDARNALAHDPGRRTVFPFGAVAFDPDGGNGLASVGTAQAALRAHLGTMQREGLLNPGADVVGLATAVTAAWQGGLLLVVASGDAAPLEAALGHAYALVWSWRAEADPRQRGPLDPEAARR